LILKVDPTGNVLLIGIGGQIVSILWTGCYYSDEMCAFIDFCHFLGGEKGSHLADEGTGKTVHPHLEQVVNLLVGHVGRNVGQSRKSGKL
jgi:hypothetical protein